MGSKRILIIAVAAALALSCYSPMLWAETRASTAKQSDEAARAQTAANVLGETWRLRIKAYPRLS